MLKTAEPGERGGFNHQPPDVIVVQLSLCAARGQKGSVLLFDYVTTFPRVHFPSKTSAGGTNSGLDTISFLTVSSSVILNGKSIWNVRWHPVSWLANTCTTWPNSWMTGEEALPPPLQRPGVTWCGRGSTVRPDAASLLFLNVFCNFLSQFYVSILCVRVCQFIYL